MLRAFIIGAIAAVKVDRNARHYQENLAVDLESQARARHRFARAPARGRR